MTGISIIWPIHFSLVIPHFTYIYTYLTYLHKDFYTTVVAFKHKKSSVHSRICNCSPSDSLRWRQNGRDSVSNHQPHDCLFNRLLRPRSKKTSKIRVTGLCVGNSPGPVNSPHKGPVTRKIFPFDDVIMLMRCLSRKKNGWLVLISRILGQFFGDGHKLTWEDRILIMW